jgi:polyhydroxyalkanoate synthesis repressor PhaR
MRIIRKYPNRRLYDTVKSAYITLPDVLQLIRQGEAFEVRDSESGEDITRSILIQIITEQEGGAAPIFTTDMLMRFIKFYDDANQAVFGEFLDRNLKFFNEQQQKLSSQLGGFMATPLQMMKDATDRNLDLWQDMQRRFFENVTTPPPAATTPPRRGRKTKKT